MKPCLSPYFRRCLRCNHVRYISQFRSKDEVCRQCRLQYLVRPAFRLPAARGYLDKLLRRPWTPEAMRA